jgi:membrane protein implicated in regulation of membrane protease activity
MRGVRRWTGPDGERAEDRRMWSGAVLAKYWAMQVPGAAIVFVILLLVAHVLAWPQWVAWGGVAAWLAKDAMLYFLVWRSYDPGYPMELPYRMEGARGVAVKRIDPSGPVRIWGELWHARLGRGARSIEEGEAVRVTAQRGLMLVVEPAETMPPPPEN